MTDKNVELPRAWFQGTQAVEGGPELTEATLEAACIKIEQHRVGYGFACFRRAYIDNVMPPRQRKEIAPLYEGDKLIGQIAIMRPFDARDWLPFIERIHPDDAKLGDVAPQYGNNLVEPRDVRIQRFNLHRGRYVLAGTEPAITMARDPDEPAPRDPRTWNTR